MLHARLAISRLRVDDHPLPLRHGDVVVAARAESGQLDWEAIVSTIEVHDLARSVHHLELICLPTATPEPRTRGLSGSAFLVRSVETTLVFRGDSVLEGFDVGWLKG